MARQRSGAADKPIGVKELKTHAARIVRRVRESRASYVLTHRGRAVGVILPIDDAGSEAVELREGDDHAAWSAFWRAGRRLQARCRPRVSGVRLLSDMRR